MEGTVHMRLRGELARKIMAIDPVYEQHVLFNKRSDPIIYVELTQGIVWHNASCITVL